MKVIANYKKRQESKWSGVSEDAFFNAEQFEHNRILKQPEYEASGRTGKNSYYILSMDVGRKGCDSVVCIFKVCPQVQGTSQKHLVNMYTFNSMHMEDQCIKVKKLFYKYKARRLIVDANGLGAGLVDYLVKSQIDPETNEVLPDFGVYGGTFEGVLNDYKKYKTSACEDNALYLIKATAPINSEAHSNVQIQLSSGKIKFLIDERIAKQKLLGTKVGQGMTPEQRGEYLKPFTLTSILRDELLNLREENEGINISLKQANRSIPKDKVSALEYGLYYIREEEDNKKKKKFNAADWIMMN